MKTSRRAQRDRRIIVIVLIVSSAVSALFGNRIAPAGASIWASAAQGVVNGLLVATPIVMLEMYGMRSAIGRRMRRLSLPSYLGVKMLIYATLIVGGSVLSRLIFLAIFDQPLRIDGVLTTSLIFGGFMAVIGNFAFEMGGLLGFGTLKRLFTGRYALPRAEQKTFLLIDMKDSTGLAERLGSIRFHELLNDFFRDVSHATLECDGEIHKYVGDEAIVTWPENAGLRDGASLLCPFLARDTIEEHRAHYLEAYGAVPEFRAALHYGEIVAGEIGDVRREIAYVGDTLNVAARLLETAKQAGNDILVSLDLLQRATLPAGLQVEEMPMLTIRGRAAPLGIAALSRS
jgi:adenylate cyclase